MYEEHFHGRTLRQVLRGAGVQVPDRRFAEVQRGRSLRERFEDVAAALLCKVSKHFHAAYLTWGAINELTTHEAYNILKRRTGNPILAEVLGRLMKDERRHFAFYYNSARARLAPEPAQRLVTFLQRRFWTPVGSGVKPDPEGAWTLRFLFDDEAGRERMAYIDGTIARLPGLGWFDMVRRELDRALAALPAPRPARFPHPSAPPIHSGRSLFAYLARPANCPGLPAGRICRPARSLPLRAARRAPRSSRAGRSRVPASAPRASHRDRAGRTIPEVRRRATGGCRGGGGGPGGRGCRRPGGRSR